jgi:hypothetical protein
MENLVDMLQLLQTFIAGLHQLEVELSNLEVL